MLNREQMNNTGLLLLRITVGGLMLFHGVAKIFNAGSVAHIGSVLAQSGIPSFISYGLYIGEVLAPLLILLGVFSRIGGIIIMLNMLVAIFLMHAGDLFALTPFGGWKIELQMFYLLGGVAIALLGSGKFAIKPD